MATRTIADGGGNYNSTGTWVEGAVPTVADDVVATATSGALTVTAAASAKTLILTGYTNTLTINSGQTLTVAGNVTLASGMTYAGSGTLAVSATATLTANGITVSGGLTLGTASAMTMTLADNWVVTGLVTTNTSNGATTLTINGNQITLNGGWTQVGCYVAGTTTFILAGTGTWTGPAATARYISNPITVNTAGTITLAENGPQFAGNTVTYTAGTIVATSSTVGIHGAVTLSGSWPQLNNVTFGSGAVLTIPGNFTIAGALRILLNSNTYIAGAYNFTCDSLYMEHATKLYIPDGKVLTVSTAITVLAASTMACLISSTTATVSSTLTYNGTAENMQIARCNFTDIVATNTLYDMWSATLTRSSGITVTSYNQGSYTDPGVANVATGTSYIYQGTTKNGSYAGGGSTVIVIED